MKKAPVRGPLVGRRERGATGRDFAAEAQNPRLRFWEERAQKSPARFPARAHFVSFNLPNNLIHGDASSTRAGESSARRLDRHYHECAWVGFAPSRHGIARSEGALSRASRADGGGSAIIRGTLTPDPASMEADRAGRVYRVSHVVDGESVNLLRPNHSEPYHFATGSLDVGRLDSDSLRRR
jgi:hypothetical protein